MSVRNRQLDERLKGLLNNLTSSYKASSPMSSASKGLERELFISGFLGQVFPEHYRFASGDIIDRDGVNSGQVDIVLEYPSGFSFPVFAGGPRLFLAESVAAVIEVKSDLASQWDQVVKKASMIGELNRRFTKQLVEEFAEAILEGKIKLEDGQDPESMAATSKMIAESFNDVEVKIPLYVVGFTGWADEAFILGKIRNENIAGVFQVRQQLYVSKSVSATNSESVVLFLEMLESHLLKDTAKVKVISNYFRDFPEID